MKSDALHVLQAVNRAAERGSFAPVAAGLSVSLSSLRRRIFTDTIACRARLLRARCRTPAG